MTLQSRVGYGWTVGVDSTGGTSFTTLGAVVEGFKGPGAKRDKVDITLLSDLWKRFAGAQIDPGELAFTIAWDPGDATTTQTLTALLKSTSGVEPNWQLTYPAFGGGGSGSQTFKGILLGFSPTVMEDKMATSEVTVQVSGNPNFA